MAQAYMQSPNPKANNSLFKQYQAYNPKPTKQAQIS